MSADFVCPVIHRQSIPIDDAVHAVEVPEGCMITAGRAPSSPNDVLDIWYAFVPGGTTQTMHLKVYATGQPWEDGRQWSWLGSWIDDDLGLVWHLVRVFL